MDFEYESKFLDDYLMSLRYFKPFLYQKMKFTGILAIKIGKEMGIDDEEYKLACFYSNIGLVGVAKYVEEPRHLNEEELFQVRRHPAVAKEYLSHKGLKRVSDIVYHHHEYPDGSGYFNISTYPIEADYIHIADKFHGAISPKPYRPAYTFDEALKITFEKYADGLKIPKDDLKKIEEVLRGFYDDMLTMF